MGQNSQGLRFAVFSHEFLPVPYCLRISPEERYSSFREGPLQMGIADLFPRRAEFLSGRLFSGFHQSAVREKILNPGETIDIMYLVKNYQANPVDTG
jgi:hypothetical protein